MRAITMPIIHLHRREQRSLLAEPERRALTWLAVRLPSWVSSDQLTLLGLLSMIAAGAAFAAVRVTPWAAAGVIIALAANWFGDSLDGTVARVRDQQRPRYGFYVDHVIDLAGTAALMGGLASSGRMSPLIALLVLAGYLIVSAESYLATHAAGVFRISFAGVGPTELRIVLAAGAIAMTTHPAVAIGLLPPMWLFDVGGIVTTAGLVFVFVASALRNTRSLYRAEPLQPRVESAA
jgi:phosphatidylglycerophosphate synthase